MKVQIHLWLFHFFRRPIQILYIRNHIATWPSALLARLVGIPVVQEVNGHYDHWVLMWPFLRHGKGLYQGALQSQFRLAKAVVAVNDALREWILKERGREPVLIIPNGANTDLFHPGALSGRDLPLPYVIFFGALSPWQGLDTLFEATRRAQWPSEVSLVVLGDGVEKEKVERESRKNPRVRYLGRQPYRQVPGLVAQSLAGLDCKTNLGMEGLSFTPLKMFETLSCGVPIITSDLPGQGEIPRHHQCGLVIPSESPQHLAEAVAWLHSHPLEQKEMGRKGREVMLREHSWDQRAGMTHDLLKSLLG